MTATLAPRLLSVQPVGDGGGSEKALIRMIGELVEAGWECHVAVPSRPRLASEYAAAGATVHVVAMPRLTTSGHASRWLAYLMAWPISVVRLALLARRLGTDVVHSNSLHSWQGWAVATLIRRPHVWHAREIVFQSVAALRLERWLARRYANSVIAMSAAIASQLDPGNVTIIIDDADPDVFRPDRAGQFRERVGIADGTPLVGSVARIDTWKGFEVLIEAVSILQAARPDVELAIAGGTVAGKEAYAAALKGATESLPGVHWLGPRDDVADLMADLDVFVQVSTEPEPFGLVVVEALASGVPVVAGAAGGPLEILGPEAVQTTVPAGRLVKPGDPAALGEAVLGLLPATPSSSRSRRQRRRLREPSTADFAAFFRQVAAAGRRGRYRRPPLSTTTGPRSHP